MKQLRHVITNGVVSIRQVRHGQAQALRDNPRHLHCLNAEVALAKELKLRHFRQHGIHLAINAEVTFLKLVITDDDLPAKYNRQTNLVSAFDGMDRFNLLDTCKFSHRCFLSLLEIRALYKRSATGHKRRASAWVYRQHIDRRVSFAKSQGETHRLLEEAVSYRWL